MNLRNCEMCIESDQQATAITRRSFFSALLVGIGSTAIGAVLAVPGLRYVLYPLYTGSSSRQWSEVGKVDDFAINASPVRKSINFAQRDGWREMDSPESIYVNRLADDRFEVLSAICPHLGCTVAWQQNANGFLCPCHGSVFKPDGQLVKGPAPRGMDTLPTRIQKGKLQVYFEFFRSDAPNKELLS